MSDKFFSISEAAQYLGVFPLSLRNWERRGLIKSFRTPGGHRRFKRSDLDRIAGIGTIVDRLRDTMDRLREIDFETGSQEKMNKLIMDLKNMTEDYEKKSKSNNK